MKSAATLALGGSSRSRRHRPYYNYYHHQVVFLASYLIFGLLHELLGHALIAKLLFGFSSSADNDVDVSVNETSYPFSPVISFYGSGAISMLVRAILGRCYVNLVSTDKNLPSAFQHKLMLHMGWVVSWILALSCHYIHRNYIITIRLRQDDNKQQTYYCSGGSTSIKRLVRKILSEPNVILAAYATAIDATLTDLLGWVPVTHRLLFNNLSSIVSTTPMAIYYCGNFGILLLNSQWIKHDGGKSALDMLEQMIYITMMRGAQSGGVVTFEPSNYGNIDNNDGGRPKLRAIRSRVVNKKRGTLSKAIRYKVESDNRSNALTNKLRGWDSSEFVGSDNNNNNSNMRRLIRAFYGHTRFATSSKATFDGTHPHRWSKRKEYHMYEFRSLKYATSPVDESAASSPSMIQKGVMGLENFVTHNGDFEFYRINDKFYDTETIQNWLTKALNSPMPSTVDSVAIAGMIDLLRTQGSFSLSVRYVLCFAGNEVSNIFERELDPSDPTLSYPTMEAYTNIEKIFEKGLEDYIEKNNAKTLEEISSSDEKRASLVKEIAEALQFTPALILEPFVGECTSFDVEMGTSFVRRVVDAFFDNDLFHSVRLFLENAKGSFGLCVVNSVDAHRQVCIAAKGQTNSIAFYPRKGVVCYGSEQAAVKAGLNFPVPSQNTSRQQEFCVDEDAFRLDLDDLGGEICLIDWGYDHDVEPAISQPNRNLPVEKLMGGKVNVILLRQSMASNIPQQLSNRYISLENNEFMKPLPCDCPDQVLRDIRDIPKVCDNIQKDWRNVGSNRMAAWQLGICLQHRLRAYETGTIQRDGTAVDILVTGCEVSLWLAEQFVSDLKKCFPKLFLKAVSSNKLLGLFGQDLPMPAIGFQESQKTFSLKDTIVIIVSHSGGTFAPLACSNLLQSFSSSIFAVTSEWDTQIGKQLRHMYMDNNDLVTGRIFSTECGVRTAEPCSVSVAATHQLLTNIFQFICITIISKPHFCYISGAVVTERDLQCLERCNNDNIKALEYIVGTDTHGYTWDHNLVPSLEPRLRAAGDVWAEHVLEVAKAYLMSIFYILVTVTTGFPVVTAIARAFTRAEMPMGYEMDHGGYYVPHFLDALIYIWLPQICITIIRIFQRRNLRHRMVARTVVVADVCPWVAQCADQFLSKLFACSYSIAGITVLNGNPADHFVHRHTHRVVRGTLLLCGRPDGRLSALTSLETSTCLAVNQASSIQSIGGTCETITIGHNKTKLPLSKDGIFLERNRPKFLCEKLVNDSDEKTKFRTQSTFNSSVKSFSSRSKSTSSRFLLQKFGGLVAQTGKTVAQTGQNSLETITTPLEVISTPLQALNPLTRTAEEPDLGESVQHTSNALIGFYTEMRDKARRDSKTVDNRDNVSNVIQNMINNEKGHARIREAFDSIDVDRNGYIDRNEFVKAYLKINPNVSISQLETLFMECDTNDDGVIDFDEFATLSSMPHIEALSNLNVANRDERGLLQVQPSEEEFFGEELKRNTPIHLGSILIAKSQHLSQELYESRVASLQRFVAMTVMFHQMGSRVQAFFPKISFGMLGYRIDRTHSIMRIATTASPVSGADVRDRMVELHFRFKILKAVDKICRFLKNQRSTRQQDDKSD